MATAQEAREWRRKNPEKSRLQSRRHNKRFREKLGPEAFRAYMRKYQQAEYAKNPEKVLARNRAWLAKLDPEVRNERKRAAQARYWAKHRDKIHARNRKRYATIPKIKTQVQEWKKAHPDRVKILRNRGNGIRRARERAATIGDLTAIAKVYDRCQWWRQWFDASVDHIISLAKGGTHEAKNLQIIYGFENSRKHTNPDYKPRVVFV